MNAEERTRARRAVAAEAAALCASGMIIGLGTGDSASHGIRALAARGLTGLRCVATSQRSAELAQSLGLPLCALDDLTELGDRPIDLTFDGADEIDPALRLIKGGGGALLREKLVAQASRRMVVLADEDKLSPRLGTRFALPLELVPFGVPQTLARIAAFLGTPEAKVALRRDAAGVPLRSDGGNAIADAKIGAVDARSDGRTPEEIHAGLKRLTGVIDTGLFLTEADTVLVGQADGSVRSLRRG